MLSTRCSGRVVSVCEFSRCPSAVPDYSNLDRGPAGSPAVPRESGLCRWARYRPSVPVDSGPCPSAHGIDEPSRVTRVHDRVSAGLTSYSRRLVIVSECPGGPPVLLGESGSSPTAGRVDQLSRATKARVRGPQSRPAVSRDSGTSSRSCSVEQLPRALRAQVQRPPGSTSCPGLITLGLEGLCSRPAPRKTRAHERGPAE